MVKLSEFIGEIVSDISEARKIADSNSVALSQSYHADPFLRGIPVPHYTIQEAEVKVPVCVNSVSSAVLSKNRLKKAIPGIISGKLPTLLGSCFVTGYIERKKKEDDQKAAEEEKKKQQVSDIVETASAAADILPENITANISADNLLKETAAQTDHAGEPSQSNPLPGRLAAESGKFSESEPETNPAAIDERVCKCFLDSAARITQSVSGYMKTYLETVDIDIVKLLGVRDKFIETLITALTGEFAGHELDPFENDEAKTKAAAEIGAAMFVEFNRVSERDKGVFVEPSTGKMNEYAQKGNLMYITVRIKEQDLDVVIEGDGSQTPRRFLSLS
ncbi:MAG: hypothetical protein K2K57_00765 [Oscillospiraceae bacterium]|nr:hypothetical protein [Oscillospiraceae bacterium]